MDFKNLEGDAFWPNHLIQFLTDAHLELYHKSISNFSHFTDKKHAVGRIGGREVAENYFITQVLVQISVFEVVVTQEGPL